MPGHIAAFVRRDGALDIRAGEHGNQCVDGVCADGFFNVCLYVACVLLGAHFEIREEIAQRHSVWQVVP